MSERWDMRTFADEAVALDAMRGLNRHSRFKTWVMVEGPDDNEFTILPMRDAIDGEFFYRWEV
jgi:hypothetical protein